MKNFSFSAFLFVFAIILSTNISYALQASTPPDSAITTIMEERKIPGLSYAVVKGGKTVAIKSFGYRNLDVNTPETPKTNHFIASTTKTFTGIGVMKLVETGQIKLDESIRTYLPEVHPEWAKVTVRQAISHTSGLPSILDENGDPIGGDDITQAWEIVKDKPLVKQPGQEWKYSQIGLEVIQRIAKKVTGESWESHITNTIFKPAEMTNSFWLWDMPSETPNRSVMYEVSDNEDAGIKKYGIQNNFDYYLPAGTGIFTNANDMANYAKTLQTGKLLEPELLLTMWTSSEFEESAFEWMQGYGIGWILDEYRGQQRAWHSGGGKAIFMHYPEQQLSIIVLTNLADGGVFPFANKLSDFYLD